MSELDFKREEFSHSANIEYIEVDSVNPVLSLDGINVDGIVKIDHMNVIDGLNSFNEFISLINHRVSTIVNVVFQFDTYKLITCSIKWKKGLHRGINNACLCAIFIRDLCNTYVEDVYEKDISRAMINWYISKLKERCE